MISEIRYCEDCEKDVEVWGGLEGNSDQTNGLRFVVEETPEHEGHDIS